MREIGIRLVAAQASHVMCTVTRHALVTGLTGSIFGSAAAPALASTLEDVLYGVRAKDAFSFASAPATLLAVTAIAAVVPAIRRGQLLRLGNYPLDADPC